VEADRVAMLEGAFRGLPTEIDLAVARRLLAHAEADRLIGGLIASFFGGAVVGDVDEAAASARRARKPKPVPEPAAPKQKAAKAVADDDGATAEDEPESDAETATLYVNVGKRDDARADALGEWLVKETGLLADAFLRVKVKEKHAFVEVRDERADEIIAAIAGKRWGDREVFAERARPKA
jgi:hypothetical protein